MAADPTKCKVNVVNGAIISEWTGSFAEFKGKVKPEKPDTACTQSDWKNMLEKWLIAQFVCACIIFPAQLVLYIVAAVLGGGSIGDVISTYIGTIVFGIIGAFITAWVGWFMMIKRQPNCCCICIFWIEDWKYQHLLFGIYCVLNGCSQLWNAINAALSSLDYMDALGPVYVLLWFLAAALVAIYAVCLIYVGRAALGLGQEISGASLPSAPSVPGKAEAQA
jgi:hypothetical protein